MAGFSILNDVILNPEVLSVILEDEFSESDTETVKDQFSKSSSAPRNRNRKYALEEMDFLSEKKFTRMFRLNRTDLLVKDLFGKIMNENTSSDTGILSNEIQTVPTDTGTSNNKTKSTDPKKLKVSAPKFSTPKQNNSLQQPPARKIEINLTTNLSNNDYTNNNNNTANNEGAKINNAIMLDEEKVEYELCLKIVSNPGITNDNIKKQALDTLQKIMDEKKRRRTDNYKETTNKIFWKRK
jgi:hypothetical protein